MILLKTLMDKFRLGVCCTEGIREMSKTSLVQLFLYSLVKRVQILIQVWSSVFLPVPQYSRDVKDLSF